ncbi:MAG: hypothetical protein AB7P04_11020 [Bacteriovoracia bacterium]
MKKLSLLTLFLLCLGPTAGAVTDDTLGDPDFENPEIARRVPKVLLQSIDDQGNVKDLNWKTESRWVWKKTTDEPFQSPLLRTWIVLPTEITMNSVTGSIYTSTKNPGDAPFESKGDILAIEANYPVQKMALRFETKGKGGRPRTLNLVLTYLITEPYLLVHSTCSKMGLEITHLGGKSGHLFNAVWCMGSPSALEMYVLYPQDSEVRENHIPGRQKSGKGWVFHQLGDMRAKIEQAGADVLGTFQVGTRETKKFAEFAVAFVKRGSRSHLKLFASLGSTYINYQEDVLDVNLRELDFRARVDAEYSVLPEKLDMSGRFYGSIISLRKFPGSNAPDSAARFWGLDLNADYHLPWMIGGTTRFRIGLGYYLWGMFVPSDAYGVQNFNGVQTRVTVRWARAGRRAIRGEFVFAPITSGTSELRFYNRQLAAELGFQLSHPTADREWWIVANWQNAKYTARASDNTVNYTSYGLLLQVGL